MRRFGLLAFTVVGLLWVAPVQAHHVVFLDFSGFSLSAYSTVNGHTPPTASDVTAVQELVIANMVKDYAPFDIHFVTAQPVNGRFTRVALFDDTAGGLFGCAVGSGFALPVGFVLLLPAKIRVGLGSPEPSRSAERSESGEAGGRHQRFGGRGKGVCAPRQSRTGRDRTSGPGFSGSRGKFSEPLISLAAKRRKDIGNRWKL